MYDHVNGFRYQIVDEGGSSYIRRRCCVACSTRRRKSGRTTSRRKPRSPTTTTFFDAGSPAADGLSAVGVMPKRKDLLLVEGSVFVQPRTASLAH